MDNPTIARSGLLKTLTLRAWSLPFLCLAMQVHAPAAQAQISCPVIQTVPGGPGQGTPGGPATPGGPGAPDTGTTQICPPINEPPDGSISAAPSVCNLNETATQCASTITWSTSNASTVEVRVLYHDTGTSQVFSTAKNAASVAPWINATGMRFDLRLDGNLWGSVEVIANPPPSVSLTAPAAGAVVISGQTTTLTASASDADGVSKVEFFDGATPIATDTTAPFSVPWSSTALGSHSLSARATDTRGAVRTSVPVLVTVSKVTLSATNKTVNSSVASGSTASAAFRLASAGKIRFQTSVGGAWVEQSPLEEWLEPESATQALNFQVFATLISSPVGGTLSGPVGTWVGLGSASPDWTLTRATAGSSQAVVNLQIRRIGTTTNLATTNVTLNATVAPPPNIPPSVSLTSPSNGQRFDVPAGGAATIPLSATASDPDGTVSKVEFFQQGSTTPIAVDATAPSPFTGSWNNVPVGTYTLTAKATDNLGASTVSSPAVTVIVNALPTASMPAPPAQTAPAGGTCTFSLSASASDSDGSIIKVEFLNSGVLLPATTGNPNPDTTAPYGYTWSNVAPGSYNLSARATDNRGATANSTPVTAVCNALPTVNITAPVAGSTQPTSFDLTASATDSDGSIASVQFFEGAVAIHSPPLTTAPYTFRWNNVALGSHTVTARAIDNRGAVKTSNPVTFTVADVPPTATLTTPANGSSYTRPAGPTLTATASTSAGTISKVEFFDNGVWLGEDTTSPYTYPSDGTTWNTTNVAAGSHSLTARATNSLGTVGPLSTAVTITLFNPNPTVNFTTPANGSSVAEGAQVTLTATASIALGSITQVEFFDGATPIGLPDTVAPYSVVWTASGIGSHVLTAKATSSLGTSKVSEPVTITVTNPPPTITLSAPSAGATFTAPAQITLSADASDANGTITKVEFLNGGVALLGSTGNPNPDTTAPYAFTWNNVPSGSYTLTAKATDNEGASTTSSPAITITVNAAPPPPPPPPVAPPTLDPLSDSVGASAGAFRVDESGAATYSIPLFAAPGTAGVTPQLALAYSSQGGDGPMGQGWAVSGTSSIARCRASREAADFSVNGQVVDGDPPPVNFSASDRFCLDGQRLIAIPAATRTCPAVAGADVDEYRTEVESFQRICAYRPTGAQWPRYFTLDGKDGSTRWYGDRDTRTSPGSAGNRSDGVLLSNASASIGETIVWAQTRFQDSLGNYIDYAYLKDPAGTGFVGEQLLAEVRYTGKVNLPGQSGPTLTPYARIVFNYVARPATEFSLSYMAGSRLWQSRQLANVESISDGATLRHYALEYQLSVSGSGRRLLNRVTECRDSSLANCLAPTTFAWSTARNTFESSEGTAADFDNMVSFRLGDVDGDGRLDMVWFKQASGSCTANLFVGFGQIDGSGRLTFQQPAQTPYCTTQALSGIDGAWQLLDYDGDGRDDLFVSTVGESWAMLPALGRPTTSGRVFDATRNLIANLSPVIGTFGDNADLVMLADLNGDGLLDVMYPKGGERMARLMEPAGSTYAWGNERRVMVAGEGEEGACGGFIGNSDCWFSGAFSARAGKVALNDFDGDARSDVLLNRHFRFETGQCPIPVLPPPPPGETVVVNGETITAYPASTALAMGDQLTVQGTDGLVCTTSRTELVAMRVLSVQADAIILREYGKWKTADSQSSPELLDIKFADFNGDGLTDALLKSATGSWSARLNTGLGFNGINAIIGALPNEKQLQITDLNGDGRADIAYPNGNGLRPFSMRAARADGSFAGESAVPGGQANGCDANGCDLDKRAHLFADFDADGALDFVRFKFGEVGISASRASTASLHRPRDVITTISNGLGALTKLSWLPLTNAEVYRGDVGSRNGFRSGFAAPVHDVRAPAYVIAKAESSAPTLTNANALSSVFYRYQGGKAQAGGRGWLGFAAITSIESNYPGRQDAALPDAVLLFTTAQHVVTVTDYRQDFPYTGLPQRTRTFVVAGPYSPGACFSATGARLADNACFQPAGTAFPTPSGTVIADSTQVWDAPAFSSPVLQQPIIVQAIGSDERSFELNGGGLISRIVTAFVYDGFGNPTLTAVDTFGSGAQSLRTLETSNSYVNEATHWRLGRLMTSTVSHRQGGDVLQRHTRFTYAMSGDYSGLLTGEYLQEGAGSEQALKTLHDYDVFGNRIATYTCSDHFSDAACRSTAIDFNPADPLRIQRYARTLYDSIGRFVVSTRQPFATGELATQSVLARNAFGDIAQVRDINGALAIAQYGPLGRTQYAWSQTIPGTTTGDPGEGIESWTTYRWCGTAAGQADCPAGARFREQAISEGGPTRWTYFDVLGRPVLAAAQSFNAGQTGMDFAASCTAYDARGNPERSSTPFFLPLAASGGAPAFAGGNPCVSAARLWARTIGDAIDRTLAVVQPDGSSTVSLYSAAAGGGGRVSFIDALGNPRSEVRSALGELATSTDAGGLSTTYAYDAIGNLVSVSRDAGRGEILTYMAYDALGRKIAQHDPDAGDWIYEYNALGEQIAQRDTFEDRTTIAQWRDARGRV
ncbi:MAG: Ig-like domain-containing protein, partial [Xanthomonadales bacterium]|nr:Ig-like domain-containing protein [Xanthomonadales bacterium]MDZ4117101.1 Ig-like domain-containing protein [Xanthomonadaceae bacterium]